LETEGVIPLFLPLIKGDEGGLLKRQISVGCVHRTRRLKANTKHYQAEEEVNVHGTEKTYFYPGE
jgi:hypothetical protein